MIFKRGENNVSYEFIVRSVCVSHSKVAIFQWLSVAVQGIIIQSIISHVICRLLGLV